MEQLNLFTAEKPILPTFEYLSYVAGRLKIRVAGKDKKDHAGLFLKCWNRIIPMIQGYLDASKRGEMEPWVSPDFHLFFIHNEKAAQTLLGDDHAMITKIPQPGGSGRGR